MSERGPIETRSATVTDVRYPERIIDLIAVPYNEWAVIEYKGRLIEESFDPKAFGNGIEQRAQRFTVNMEHDPNRFAGRCVTLDPKRSEGLVAGIKIRRGPEGDQILDDADDGMIGASIGFATLPEYQHWETRSRRRVMKAFLDHIGLTFTPAYQGGRVLAVRSARPVPTLPPAPVAPALTPNLDRITLAEMVARYARL